MKAAIAAFAKTPGVSPVKTRLSKTIGKRKAEAFYRYSLLATEEMLLLERESSKHRVFPYWAIAEADQLDNPNWKNLPAIWTGSGGLGERLSSVSKELHNTYGAVLLIGTDCPQLQAGITDEALALISNSKADCVIGPSTDGGFYLFASSNPVEPRIWQSVAYSVETTRQELVEKLVAEGFKIAFMREERDVDTVDDLAALAKRLASEPDLPAAKAALFRWLDKLSL